MAGKDPRERYHDRVAPRYEGIYDTAYWRLYRELSWRFLLRFLPRERPLSALDLGCGPGWFGTRLLKAGCRVAFLDLSGAMLDQARAAVAALRRPEAASFHRCDLADLGTFPDGAIDFATAQGDPLGFTASPARALKELHRVLRPGGRAVLSVDHRAAAAAHYLARRDPAGLERFLRTGEAEWLARRAEERFPIHMFDVEELLGLLAGAGLTALEIVGRTVLLQREHEDLLAAVPLRRLVAWEERLQGRPGWLGRGHHLQVAVARPAAPAALTPSG